MAQPEADLLVGSSLSGGDAAQAMIIGCPRAQIDRSVVGARLGRSFWGGQKLIDFRSQMRRHLEQTWRRLPRERATQPSRPPPTHRSIRGTGEAGTRWPTDAGKSRASAAEWRGRWSVGSESD